jgi:hypothetical protein
VLADLDALLTALHVRVDDFLPRRCGPGHPPRITDSEMVTLAVAQMFLAVPNDRKFLALARWRLLHLFPYLPKQPGYNKAAAGAGATDRAGHHAPGGQLALVLRRAQTASQHLGPVRPIARDRPALGARRLRRLWLVQEPLALLLGLPVVFAVRL